MQKFTLLDIDLRLFDGAAGVSAGGEGSGAGVAQDNGSTLPKAETKGKSGGSRRSKSGDYSNVVFGKQGDAPAAETAPSSDAGSDKGEGNARKSGVETTSNTLEARRAAFEELIDSDEYKDIYAEKFQQAFTRRFKEVKGMETSLADQKPIMDMLMQRYNIGDGDAKKLLAALEQDDAYWEEAAEKAGLTVEQYRAQQKMARENAELRAQVQRQQGERQAQEQLNAWFKEAEQVKMLYPSFDFNKEAENKAFTDLLKARVPVQKAYEVIHMDEITAAKQKAAAETAGQQMVAKLQGNSARPLENGTSAQSAAIVKNDVHNLSRADRAEIARQAQRGVKIIY